MQPNIHTLVKPTKRYKICFKNNGSCVILFCVLLNLLNWYFIQKEFGFNTHVLNNVRAIQLQPIGYITFFQIVPSIRQVMFKHTDTLFGYLT